MSARRVNFQIWIGADIDGHGRAPVIRSIRCARVDDVLAIAHIVSVMRRILMSILLIASLTIGGAVNAWAAQDCPYLNVANSAGDHDCCPDNVMNDMAMSGAGDAGEPMDGDQPQPADTSFDCQPGQACRTVPALAWSPNELVAAPPGFNFVRQFSNDLEAPSADVELDLRPPISA